MNKIEELETRVRALESLLGVKASLAHEERPFWDPRTKSESFGFVPQKVVYKCCKGHDHDTIPEAKICTEAE